MKIPSKILKIYKHSRSFIKSQKVIASFVVIAVAGIGTYLIVISHASTPSASQEAASGKITGPAAVNNDTTASGNQSVQFGPIPTKPNPSPPVGAFNVQTYGAAGNGSTDDTAAIQTAIAAAEAAGGNQTVYFPTGTYILDNSCTTATTTPATNGCPTNSVGDNADFLIDGSKGSVINILGAGENSTEIVNEVGVSNPAFSSLTRGNDVFVFQKMNGFYFSGLSVDSGSYDGQAYNGGDDLVIYGSNTTVENSNFIGSAIGGETINGVSEDNNVFPLRVLSTVPNVCPNDESNPTTSPSPFGGSATFGNDNTINNIIVSGDGNGQNDDLDFSCQHNGTIANVTDTGWGTAIYIDYNVTVNNYNFTPGNAIAGNRIPQTPYPGYIITDSYDINLDNFTTSGEGGIVSQQYLQISPTEIYPQYPTNGVVINNEKMTTPVNSSICMGTIAKTTNTGVCQLIIQDSNNTTVNNSTLNAVNMYSEDANLSEPGGGTYFGQITGVQVNNSTVGTVFCTPSSGAGIAVSGIACP